MAVRGRAGPDPRPTKWGTAVNEELGADAAAAARHAKYGRLPGRVRFEDMSEEAEAAPVGGAGISYASEGAWKYYSCLALDLGL